MHIQNQPKEKSPPHRPSSLLIMLFVSWGALLAASPAQNRHQDPTLDIDEERKILFERISPSGESFMDPEILNEYDLMTYQKDNGEIWVAPLDPESGRFRQNGLAWLMDVGAAHPSSTLNGPEFGVDRFGWAVFYSKEVEETLQIWRSERLQGQSVAQPLTSDETRRQSALVSKDRRADTTRVIYARENLQGYLGWLDEETPGMSALVDRVDMGARWIEGTQIFVYVKQTGPEAGALALYDTQQQSERIITDTLGDKSFPYGWIAPDFGGDLLVCCLIQGTEIAIYREEDASNWSVIERITLPETSEEQVFGSPEPFVVQGKSYLSAVCKRDGTGYVPGEVWVFAVRSEQGQRWMRRVDDGKKDVVRTDPETYLGTREVFVYFNVLNDRREFEIHKARTGIPMWTDPSLVERRLPPQLCDPLTDGVNAPHVAYRHYGVPANQRLLVFFPGTNGTPWMYREFLKVAATLGYHVIGLSYENTASINLDICPPGTEDLTCHRRAREELWFGHDTHEALEVSLENTILHRLVSLLTELAWRYPGEGWELFLDESQEVTWEWVVTAGHSQGGNHAGYGAKQFEVQRALMFSCTDWVNGQTADWIRSEGATPASAFFGFIHTQDATIFSTIPATWRDFGMLAFGSLVSVDDGSPPYQHSHTLITSAPLSLPLPEMVDYHNATAVDHATPSDDQGRPLFEPVWRTLLDF